MAYSAAEILQLQERLAAYLAAEAAILRNQSAALPDGRQVTRTNLAEVRKGIEDLRREIGTATGAPIVRGRARRGVIL